MYRTFYENMTWTALPILALVLFLAVFLAVVLRVFGFCRASDFASLAKLAVDDHAPSETPGAKP